MRTYRVEYKIRERVYFSVIKAVSANLAIRQIFGKYNTSTITIVKIAYNVS